MEKTKQHCNTIEKEQRVATITEMLLQGKARAEIQLLASTYGVSGRQIDFYIADAKKAIAESKTDDLKFEIGFALRRYEMLFANCLEMQDFKTAVSIVEKRCKMFGIAEPNDKIANDNSLVIKHIFAGRTDDGIDFTDDGEMANADFSI